MQYLRTELVTMGSFINEILPFVVWKRGKYDLKVDKRESPPTPRERLAGESQFRQPTQN
jgi:hypothetical protein